MIILKKKKNILAVPFIINSKLDWENYSTKKSKISQKETSNTLAMKILKKTQTIPKAIY